MLTLDEAIQKRLEEKRRVREAAARAKAEEEAAIREGEQRVADSARRAIEEKLGCKLGAGARVRATFSHLNASETDSGVAYYSIEILLKVGQVNTDSAIGVKDNSVLPEQLDCKWCGYQLLGGSNNYRNLTVDNLLDALIYIHFGTTDPEAAADNQEMGF